MAEAGFTKGHLSGWAFREITPPRGALGYDGLGYVTNADGRDVLHVGDRELTPEQNNEVGYVAAAAPELMEALTEAHKTLSSCAYALIQHEMSEDLIERVRDAMSSARAA